MTVMTTRPPLPLIPDGAVEIGATASLVEDETGGRVFLHGILSFAWNARDIAGRRFAAVSLMQIKAATQVQIAAAFGTSPLTVWRWAQALTESGVVGLAPQRKGPRQASKLTGEMIATIRRLRGQGLSLRAIGDRVGVSEASVRRALADTEGESEKGSTAPGSDAPLAPAPEPGSGTKPETGAEPGTEREVPVLAEPADRGGVRAAAACGLIPPAAPVFTVCAHAPLAGLFLAMPALAATGMLEHAHAVYGELPNGFYSLDTMLCASIFRALLGQARRIDPVALGRILGLDRAPTVTSILRRTRALADAGRAGEWIATMAQAHAAARPEQAAVLYVDGHVRAYQGTRTLAKTQVPRLKFPAPATVETWVTDAAGDPLLVVLAEPAASLASELRRLLPDLRAIVADARRVLVGFDRGGWSPALFADLDAAGFDTLTWRTGPADDVDEALFTEHTHTDETGRSHTFTLADTEVELEIGDGPRAGQRFAMRQISLPVEARSRQMHILTTRRDLTAGEIRWRMGARWRQENYFRYARMHVVLDSHDCYAATDAPLSAALDTALAAHRAIPARLPLSQLNPGQQVLETETKLIHHAIRIAAFNTAQSLARAVRTGTGYAPAGNEAHTLIRTALADSGNILPDPDHGVLHIRLDPLPTPRHTVAVAELCALLTETDTVYPGTDLTLRYSTKPRRSPHTNS